MLRKTFPLILKPIVRPSALNWLKSTCSHFVTSCNSSSERSVLADPGIKKPEPPEKFQLQSVLSLQQVKTFDEIQALKGAQDVINFLQNNSKIIVPLYAPLFLQILQILQSNKSEMSIELFTRNPEFEKFCKLVNKTARSLRPSDALNILKALKFMKISTNSILTQNLLQILSKSINELNISQIIFLNFIIHDAPTSPIVEALKISLPVVFNANVRSKLNYGNAKSIVEALYFALSIHAPFKTVDLIVEAALTVQNEFTLEQCKDIVFGFLYNKVKAMNNVRKHLYTFCMNKIKEEMEENMPFKDISRLASLMVNSFLFADSFYYDEVFLSKVTNYVVAKQLKLSDAGKVMRTFNRISYVDLGLINYVDELLSQTKDLEQMSEGLMIILSHISSCSDARYLPPKWDTYEQIIINHFLNMEDINIPLVKIVLELVSLNRWHVPLINKVFSEDFLRQYLKRKLNKLDYFTILNLYQTVITTKEHKVDVLPPDDVIDTAIQHTKQIERDVDLSPSLELLFGGKSFVVNKICTKYGHFIDHLLVLNKNGQPLPIREQGAEDDQCLENINLPANGYAFGIVLLFPTFFCIDGVKLRGKFKLGIDTLATQNVIPVPISTTVWESLQDSEKLPYLQREIFSRAPGNDLFESTN